MLNTKLRGSLTRRGSKLLVEMIIGVIGILGIMLAQSATVQNSSIEQLVDQNGKVVQTQVANMTPKVDWLEILF